MSDSFLYTTPLDPRAQPLVEDLIHEYHARYHDVPGRDPDSARRELYRYPPDAFAPPDGAFLLLLRDGETIGGGAFMRYDNRTAELKRVWTRRDLRRQGLARKVLLQLEAQALRQGYTRLYLTTGFRQPEAKFLYLTNGYRPLFDPDEPLDPTVFRILPFEKELAPAGIAFLAEHPAAANRPFAAGLA